MSQIWNDNINEFLQLAQKHQVRMLMVGGGAVNFHGYQRHSADVDFWIDMTDRNLALLVQVFQEMGYVIDAFPEEVKNKQQNISIKFSPVDINLELITNFSINKSFDEAFDDSIETTAQDHTFLKWNVLSLDDLIDSKIKSGRPKDLLDIQELVKRNKK